jgi:hypothetical protein
MPTLDSLPGDQRAVLQLVLGRGRSYDEIARLLSIDPGAVRERAVAALDALGPQTKVPADRRALITDYLLGQLPEDQVGDVRDRLAESPSERAWARVLSSELADVASGPLPEIPAETAAARASHEPAPGPPMRTEAPPAESGDQSGVDPATAASASPGPWRRRRSQEQPAPDGPMKPPRSSRFGGSVVIITAVVVVAVVLFVVLQSGGSSPPKPIASTPVTTPITPTTSTAATSTTSTTSSAAKVVSQINLTSPTAGSKAAGIAEVLNEGSTDGIAVVAQNIPPNTTRPANAYAVWLYNSPTDAKILGFVNPGIGSTGRLSTAGGLPTNAKHFKQLIVTLETSASPKAPGQIILQGTLSGL